MLDHEDNFDIEEKCYGFGTRNFMKLGNTIQFEVLFLLNLFFHEIQRKPSLRKVYNTNGYFLV